MQLLIRWRLLPKNKWKIFNLEDLIRHIMKEISVDELSDEELEQKLLDATNKM